MSGETERIARELVEQLKDLNEALWRIAALLAEANKIARGEPHVPVS